MKAAKPILMAVVLSVFGGFATGAEFYVAPEGDDAHPGTKELPWATVEHAVEAARARPGPRKIVIRPGSVAVTDETAASGKHSLKFTDAARLQQLYAPYVTYPLEVESGVLHAGFDLRLEPEADFAYEWRDDPYTYHLGPRLSVDGQGWLSANGKRLAQLPTGQWLRIDLQCGLGPQATGGYDLTLRVPGGEPQVHRNLACSAQFNTLACVVVMSLTDGPTAFYLDNLEFRPLPQRR